MLILAVTIVDDSERTPPPGLADILWALSAAADRVEHIHVSPRAGTADITYFVRATDDLVALRAVRVLTDRALDRAPALRGWLRS